MAIISWISKEGLNRNCNVRFKRVEEEVFNSKEDGRCIEITICTEAKVEEISLQRE